MGLLPRLIQFNNALFSLSADVNSLISHIKKKDISAKLVAS